MSKIYKYGDLEMFEGRFRGATERQEVEKLRTTLSDAIKNGELDIQKEVEIITKQAAPVYQAYITKLTIDLYDGQIRGKIGIEFSRPKDPNELQQPENVIALPQDDFIIEND